MAEKSRNKSRLFGIGRKEPVATIKLVARPAPRPQDNLEYAPRPSCQYETQAVRKRRRVNGLDNGDVAGGGAEVRQRETHAGDRHGHGQVPARAGDHEGRRARGRGSRLPALRHGLPVRVGAGARRGCRGCRASRPRGVPGGGVRHLQALVHAVPPAPRAPVPPGKPPESAYGLRGPLPDPLADQPEARDEGVPGQAGARRAVRLRGRVAGDGGVPPPGPRQGHRRQQLHHLASRQDHGHCHCSACSQPGGTEPSLAAEEAEGVLRREGHPRRGVLAVLQSEVLAEIAEARGKSVAQVALRWIYEQGLSPVVKSFSKERLKQNLEIFDSKLTDDDLINIGQIPQKKIVKAANVIFSPEGEFTSLDLSDIEIVEE